MIPVLEVEGFGKSYGNVVAVESLDFTVAQGEILGLVGPNGAGKTTTLRAIAGILRPGSGRVRISGFDLVAAPVDARLRLGFIPDEPRLFEYLTVWEHVEFTARIYGTADYQGRALALLEELELGSRRDFLPTALSRGMRQKLAVMCALIHEPPLLVFDEPLTGLDPLGIRRLKEIIRDRAKAGAAVILSSHLLGLVEELCDRVLLLHSGRKILHGTLDEIRTNLPGLAIGASLEDVFLHAMGVQTTGGPDAAGPGHEG